MFALTPLTPFGALVKPQERGVPTASLDVAVVHGWIDAHQLLVLRGFEPLDEAGLLTFARRFGPLLEWEFGELLNLCTQPNPKNHLFREGRVEMHWDGAYLTETPRYSLFQCLASSHDQAGGETIFTNSAQMLALAPPEQRERWRGMTLRYASDKAAHYGGMIRAPLVDRHPHTGREILRFIEPYNEDSQDINPVSVHIEQADADEQAGLLQELTAALYGPDVMYQHGWCPGDFLLYDNHALLHGRNRLVHNVHRHLQRVHILDGDPAAENRPARFKNLP